MALTKRELNLLILTITAILVFLADSYILSPLLAARQETSQTKEALTAQIAENKNILDNKGPAARRKWKEMTDNGLLDDPAIAQNNIMSYLDNVSKECGVVLSSIQPEYSEKSGGIGTMEYTVAGAAAALDAYRLVWSIETSPLPLRVHGVHIGVTNASSSSGQVSLTLKVSAIYAYQEEKQESDSK